MTLTTKDKADNVCQTSRTIKIDKTTPSVSYVGSCTPTPPNNLCNEFKITDTYAVNIHQVRAHCAEYISDEDDLDANYCRDNFHAVDRVNYYYQGLNLAVRKTASSNDPPKLSINVSGTTITDNKVMYEKKVSNKNGTVAQNFSMNTSLGTIRDIEYAFIVCDQAGNCSGPHKFLYECTKEKSEWTCLTSNVTKQS